MPKETIQWRSAMSEVLVKMPTSEELVFHKQRIHLRNMILDPSWNFVKTYFFQRGFLDGVEGLTIAYMAALYTFLKYAKARNMS